MGIRNFKGIRDAVTPAVQLTKRDPRLAAAISKMTTSPHGTSRGGDGNRRTQVGNAHMFRSVLQKRARRNSDAAQIMRLLPDIELSAQILVSSILSPKDMTNMDLIYMGPKNLFKPALGAAMINRLKDYFDDTHKIKAQLTEMVREPLFEKGAYPIAVIPENAIDDFINSDKHISLEAMSEFVDRDGRVRNLGVLGGRTRKESSNEGRGRLRGIATEEFFFNRDRKMVDAIDWRVHYQDSTVDAWKTAYAEENLVVVDNPVVLKFPRLNAGVKSRAVKKQYSAMGGMNVAAESLDGPTLTDQQVESAIFRQRQYASEPIAVLKRPHELKRRSVGEPLVLKLPSESVIPVHVPGDMKKHIGYFVLLDEEGAPVEVADGEEAYQGIGGSASGTSASLASNLIRKVETNLNMDAGGFDPMQKAHQEYAERVYADMVERDLIARVKNGMGGTNAALARNDQVYRIMLSRVLAKKYTQVLYLPVEFMTYIAFKYGDDGIGRSLLDDTAMINTLRSVLLFSDVMASVKNSIGRTKVNAKLDPRDPNAMKTMERAQDEIVRSRMLAVPLGVSNLSDIFEFIQRAGYEWEIEGHPGLPDMKFEFMQTNTSYAKPDTELQDLLRKSSIMAMGLSPETVDNGFNTEFAATALANNVLLAKRVMLAQDQFTPQLTDHMRKLAMNSEDLVQDLKAILEEKSDGIKLELDDSGDTKHTDLDKEALKKILVNRALQEFLANFRVELPRPVSITLENQMNDLQIYSDALDKALEAYVSSEFWTTSTGGDVSTEAATVKSMIKAHYIRKWLADKGIMPELGDLVGTDDDGLPLLNLKGDITDHLKGLIRGGILALADMAPLIEAANRDMKNLEVEPSENTSTDGGGGGGGGFGGGGGGGFDDFGMGGMDDLGGPAIPGLDDPLPGEDSTGVDMPTDAEAQGNEQSAADAAGEPPAV